MNWISTATVSWMTMLPKTILMEMGVWMVLRMSSTSMAMAGRTIQRLNWTLMATGVWTTKSASLISTETVSTTMMTQS
ncbi:MAG: hypothetical protein H7A55_20230 [Verrucomicrobiaceae bacterium]|nr:hypothetical protein [Verrucomicrobiaceae bacterium]